MKTSYLIPPLLALTPTVLAQEPIDVGPVVFTASRVAQTADQTPAPVSVITRADIERSQAQSVAELLQRTPGLSITSLGGKGQQTSVFLRGSESNHVLVLIDGIKVGNATAGTTAFEQLPLAQIERIEVVRGPRSALYGAEALGGVIQIFTRKGSEGFKPNFSLGYGRYNTVEAAASVSGGTHQFWYQLGLSGLNTNGFDSCTAGPPAFAGCFDDEPDADGNHRIAGNLSAGVQLSESLSIELSMLRSDSETEFDGDTRFAGVSNVSEAVQQAIGGKLVWNASEVWDISLSAGQSRDELDGFAREAGAAGGGGFVNRFNTRRNSLGLQNYIAVGDGDLLTLGVDYLNDKVDSTNAFTQTERDNTGVFAQYLTRFGDHDVQIALRHDDNEQFGGHWTGNIGWGRELANGVRMTAAFGTAFAAPTFNDLYATSFFFNGNPNLEPESSRSIEFGLRSDQGPLRWAVNVYRTDIDDLIQLNNTFSSVINVAEARIHGIELELGTRAWGWDVGALLDITDAEDRSGGANDGNELARRPAQRLQFNLDRRFGDYSLGADLRAESRRFDDAGNTRELHGFALIDLRGEYRIDKDWRVQGRLENLFDMDYETATRYTQPGRGLYLTVRYSPE